MIVKRGEVMSTQEEQNLDLLAIFHYILGALTGLFACIPIIHLVIGIVLLTGNYNGGDVTPRSIALIFIILAAIIILVGWIFAIMIIIAGRRLKERRAYNYCLVVAFMECLIVPFGTVLGVFSIITLTKETVKELFFREG